MNFRANSANHLSSSLELKSAMPADFTIQQQKNKKTEFKANSATRLPSSVDRKSALTADLRRWKVT